MWHQRLLMLEANQGALYATFLNCLEGQSRAAPRLSIPSYITASLQGEPSRRKQYSDAPF